MKTEIEPNKNFLNPEHRAAMADALATRVGVAPPKGSGDLVRSYADLGILGTAQQCVAAERGLDATRCGLAELYLRAISTASFPEILGDSISKVLRTEFESFPGTLPQWAGEEFVKDLRENKSIVLSDFGGLTEIGDGGEFASAELSESYEKMQAKTRGVIFALTRKTWINDDTGAFLSIPQKLARAAKRDIDVKGYELLTSNSGTGPTMNEDSQALFYASRTYPNYDTGSDSVLSDSGLSAAKVRMRKRRGPGGESLNLIPRFLLVPPELEHTALKLVQSSELMIAKAGETDATEYMPTRNVHQGTLTVVVEPELSGATNGTTAWYLIASARSCKSIAIIRLAGTPREPQVERADPANVLGIGWRVWHDVGVAAIDWRGIDRSAGA